jgi:hypothetical protein
MSDFRKEDHHPETVGESGCTVPSVKRATAILVLTGGLVIALALGGGALAGGKTVKATISGTCVETDTLDHNGALKSTSFSCTASGACACDGSTKLDYSYVSTEPGTGANGRETGTIVVTGPRGALTFRLKGLHSAVGIGTGTWTIVKATGYSGVRLTRTGKYETGTKTLKQIPLSMKTTVKISTSLGCWQC